MIGLRIAVSDNSSLEHRAHLIALLAATGVDVLEAPGDLRDGEHWEWAHGQVLARHNPTHVAFMTDRFAAKPDGSRPWR